MVERVTVQLAGGALLPEGARFRYAVVERASRGARRHGAELLAFGFAPDHLRLVLDGPDGAVREVLRGLKVGTVREAAGLGLALHAGDHERTPTEDVLASVIWAHGAPGGPALETPWTSHRDLLGCREAAFFDAAPIRRRVDPRDVHARCGGDPLPRVGPPARPPEPVLLLRVAAGVLGVLPADRRCFRLFVHLAKSCGARTGDLARVLSLTSRRIRQLAATPERLLPLARLTLADARLLRVP